MCNWSDFGLNRGAKAQTDRDITNGKSQGGLGFRNEESGQKLTSYVNVYPNKGIPHAKKYATSFDLIRFWHLRRWRGRRIGCRNPDLNKGNVSEGAL